MIMSKKSERIDILLMQNGQVSSLEKAKQIIMAGNVFVNDQMVDKPGKLVSIESNIVLKESDPCPFVSRGGLKLKKAINEFVINVNGKIALDVGASTGGFTDCLLQNGAKFVYAVDVGYGLLDWKIRNDERVRVIERTNIRYIKPEQFDKLIDLATIDVSFISLDKVVPVVASLLVSQGEILSLVKPQFEASRELVGKGGVVRDPNVHQKVIQNVCDMAINTGLVVKGINYSPIKGPAGNIEYFLWLQKKEDYGLDSIPDTIDQIVSEAHKADWKIQRLEDWKIGRLED
jgi:23S rRNA (cytidine1920-2'-O)/16S rRNA (cytidine1409-2'-O)-methyltransferase